MITTFQEMPILRVNVLLDLIYLEELKFLLLEKCYADMKLCRLLTMDPIVF